MVIDCFFMTKVGFDTKYSPDFIFTQVFDYI